MMVRFQSSFLIQIQVKAIPLAETYKTNQRNPAGQALGCHEGATFETFSNTELGSGYTH